MVRRKGGRKMSEAHSRKEIFVYYAKIFAIMTAVFYIVIMVYGRINFESGKLAIKDALVFLCGAAILFPLTLLYIKTWVLYFTHFKSIRKSGLRPNFIEFLILIMNAVIVIMLIHMASVSIAASTLIIESLFASQ